MLNEIEAKQAALEEAKAELRKQRADYEALLAEVQAMKLESVEVETPEVVAPTKKTKKIVPSFEKWLNMQIHLVIMRASKQLLILKAILSNITLVRRCI